MDHIINNARRHVFKNFICQRIKFSLLIRVFVTVSLSVESKINLSNWICVQTSLCWRHHLRYYRNSGSAIPMYPIIIGKRNTHSSINEE